jgi:hypothetical protein
LAGEAPGDQIKNLDLARRQARKLCRQRIGDSTASVRERAGQPAVDRRHELGVVDQLSMKSQRPP